MKNLKTILIIFLIFCYLINYSQTAITPSGMPISFSNNDIFNDRSSSSLNALNLPSLNNNALRSHADSIQQNCISCGQQNYYGTGIRNSIDLKNNAQYYNPSIAGGKLWILKISSSTALGFQFYFSTFNLPDESFLHIYTADSVIMGPYTSANNPNDITQQIQFGTIPIMGNEVYLEYFESNASEFSGSIIIDNIIHMFEAPFLNPTRDPSEPCQKDAACRAGWGPEINSVAKILIYDIALNLTGEASGALINTTNQNGIPYFLTAAHVYNNTNPLYDVSTWKFLFDYENLTCLPSFAGTQPIPQQVVYGATVLAQDQIDASNPLAIKSINSDYLLLKLNTTALDLSNMGVCYSGWSRFPPLTQFSFSPSDEFTFIHHPNGDVKKISVGNNLVQSNLVSTWTPTNIYKLGITYGGGIENGSSGCPLFNYNHKIIGLSSGYGSFLGVTYDACNAGSTGTGTGGQFFGRFDSQWIQGSFKQWLDPLNLTDANPFYDGPGTYCPNPSAQIIEPPVINTFQGLNQGFKIRGKSGVPILCSTDNNDNLMVTPLVGTQFYIDGYIKKVECNSVNDPNGSLSGCDPITFLGIPNGKCKCSYYSYQVYIDELDYNLNPTGVSATKVYESRTWTSTIHGISNFSINVPEVLGYSFIVGKFYKVGIATVVSGIWNYSSQVIFVLPNSITISNNSNVSSNIYAISDITIENTTVSNPIQIVASNQIIINPNSNLEAGEYFIEDVDCNSVRIGEIQNSNATHTYSSNKDFTSSSERKEIEPLLFLGTKNITIFPNPNNGTFKISITKNNQSIGVNNVKVYDLMGKIVWENITPSGNIFNVDISGYASGIYYVRAINEAGDIDLKKLIKQ